ncbi:MAG: hypothetical protein PVH62_02725 [Anaerolineae bacterium]|jgi:hypothetical protein
MGKRALWITLGVFALLALTSSAAWAAPGLDDEVLQTDTLWVTLAPLIAIATSVERVLEVVWDRWEKARVWPNLAGVPNTKASDYVSSKRIRSHWLGTFLAVIAIGLTNVRFFRLLGFEVLFDSLVLFDSPMGGIFASFTLGTLIDWLMTAGIIGWGGTELTHSIIEGLVRGRNLWREMQEVQQGRKSMLDIRFFNEFIKPELEKQGISVEMLRDAFQTLRVTSVSVDEFAASMTVGEVDKFLGQLEEKAETEPEKGRAAQAVRNLLEGVPPEKHPEIPNIINLLTREQRRRLLGF